MEDKQKICDLLLPALQATRNLSDLVELPFHMEQGGTKVIYIGNKDWD